MRAGINKPDPVGGPAKSEGGAWKWTPGEPSPTGTARTCSWRPRPTVLIVSQRSLAIGTSDTRQETTGSNGDDSALRECDESRSTRYSERHSAQKDVDIGLPRTARSWRWMGSNSKPRRGEVQVYLDTHLDVRA
jgi:hypothetical protein